MKVPLFSYGPTSPNKNECIHILQFRPNKNAMKKENNTAQACYIAKLAAPASPVFFSKQKRFGIFLFDFIYNIQI